MELRTGDVAVVTGAASGIGEALASRLAERGLRVAMLDVHAERLLAHAERLTAQGATVRAMVVDVGDREALTAAAAESARTLGSAALVVANAGVATYGTFGEVPEAHFDRVLRVNLHGVIHTTRAFWPQLLAAPRAHLVTISSVFGLVAPPGQAAYAAAKFGVRGFTEALRHEADGTALRVSVVHPGGIRTRIAEHATYDTTRFTPAQRAEKVARFAQLARTTPEGAARRILRGIERDEPRILVGPDARIIAWLQRLSPLGYWRILRTLTGEL
jgi:short-subunit dehydrogenase